MAVLEIAGDPPLCASNIPSRHALMLQITGQGRFKIMSLITWYGGESLLVEIVHVSPT
jgi:hypothetical protein